jgi:hypothetical protein
VHYTAHTVLAKTLTYADNPQYCAFVTPNYAYEPHT